MQSFTQTHITDFLFWDVLNIYSINIDSSVL